jgi:LPXTG-motif cell wall-anchored protein
MTLTCTPEENVDFVLHAHDEMCYDDGEELICTLQERQEHTHTAECYSQDGTLNCTLPEIQEHLHNEDCQTNGVVSCGLPEISAHQHNSDCRAVVTEKVQTCEPGRVAHRHDSLCYDLLGNLVCTLEETDGHIHTEDCYTQETALSCGEAETTGHTHGDDCYTLADGEAEQEAALVCEQEETEGHTHTDACYTVTETLTCTQQETQGHQHTGACFSETPVTKTAAVLTCTQQEHTHEESCFEAPESLQFTYADDLVSGTITLNWDDALPDDLSCTVLPLDEEAEDYQRMVERIDETLVDDSLSCLDLQLYQLRWESQGEEYTLPEGVEPVVELTLLERFDTSSGASLTGLVLSEMDAETANQEEAIEAAAIPETAKKSARRAVSQTVEEEESTTYDVSLVDVEDDTLSVSLRSTNTFGVAALSPSVTVTGGYYRRVQSIAELQKLTFSSDYSASSVNSYNKFVFVFANGMYALEGTTVDNDDTQNGVVGHVYDATKVFYPTFQLHKVEVQQVAGNTNYVTIKDASTGTVYSPAAMKTQNYIIQSPHPNYSGNTSVYLLRELGASADAWTYFRSGTYGRTSDKWSDGIRFEYDSDRNTFHMYTEENGYLSTNITPDANAYDGYNYKDTLGTLDAVALTTKAETAAVVVEDEILDNNNGNQQVNNSEILIYVYEETTLTIPNVNLSSESQTVLPRATQPTYTTQTDTVSGAKEGTEEDSGYQYASDAATSQIESLLSASAYPSSYTQEEIYAAQQKNDGRIVTDKTVIYGSDDYKAFDSYAADEFSVTLSALGQEWTISDETDVDSPIDVIFLLDFSGSMTDVASVSDTTTQRWQAVLNATNKAMSYVLSSNPENRVGVVCYSNEAKTLLPLGSYALAEGYQTTYKDYTDGYICYDTTAEPTAAEAYYGWTKYDAMRETVATHPALAVKNESTGTYEYYNNRTPVTAWDTGIWSATYTQKGLQQVYKEFAKATTTYTKTVSNQTVSVQRKPVIILLSDGEPTQATFNYMDPVSGPKYGVGTVAENGMLGYYTILSANYFKNMTSIHYGNTTAFYTIGVGIKPSGTGSYSVEASATQTTAYLVDDSYGRAVLDPSKANIQALAAKPTYAYSNDDTNYKLNLAYSHASRLLYDLLEGNDTTSYIQNLESYYSDASDWDKYSTFELWMRAISNPFTNYDYADDSMFYGDFTQAQLEECFKDIVETVQLVNNYGFLLKDHSSVTITDPIGQGMEVKDTPVLSYFGTLYRNPTKTQQEGYVEYTWKVTATRQASDSKGSNVQLDLSVIKARVYTDQDGTQTVKFIIPEEVMPTLYPDLHKSFYYEELPVRLIYKVGLQSGVMDSMELGDSETYYTNAFTVDGTSTKAKTTVTFTPEDNNPYYSEKSGVTSEVQKTKNTTETAEDSFQESVSGNAVTQYLGNNGLLTVSKSEILTLTKAWDGVPEADWKDVTLWIFREKAYLNEDGEVTGHGKTESYGTQILSKDNRWMVTLKNPEYGGKDETGTYVWKYYVTENNVAMTKYRVYYTDSNGNLLNFVTRDVTAPDGYAYYGLRLYPLSGTVTINNHSGKLTVTKVWDGDQIGADSVTVYIYKTTTPVYGNVTSAQTKLFQTVTLSAANHWTYTYDYAFTYGLSDDLSAYCYLDYFVTEEPIDGYAATYTYPSGSSLSPVSLTVGNEAVSAYPAVRDVTITNAENGLTSITVEKTWGDGTKTKPVRVVLYAMLTRTDKETGAETHTYNVVMPNGHEYWPGINIYTEDAVITLSESNDWTYTWTDLPLYEEDNEATIRIDYYLYEVDQDGYIVTYLDKSGQTIETTECEVKYVKGSESRFGETIQAVHVNGGKVIIHNNGQVTLPHAGGVGTKWFYLMGAVLMAGAGGVLLLQKKRKTN